MPIVRSVNVGRPERYEWAALGATSIHKAPVTGPVQVTRLGLAGDTHVDTKHHGGEEQAVYAFAREDLDTWGAQLGADLPDGQF
ncbi:MAG: MOSC domain-containing protein, partial [Nocardioides sp.]|nr:MOSC domain-containing protein [Nocardioides sp.]